MNGNAFITRFEIIMYSTLTSVMSGMDHLRAKFQNVAVLPAPPTPNSEADQFVLDAQPQRGSFSLTLDSIKIAMFSLFLWIILGFAAGFLIGMLKPR
jgi:hypothetical protein